MKTITERNISILRPGGNDTALIRGIPPKSLRKRINDTVMKQYATVEQVGFYEYSSFDNTARLEMAGGEFCGNATRSLAYLLLNGKKGEIKICVSGTKQVLSAGVLKQGTAFSQMPIKTSFSSVTQCAENFWEVKLDGITHLVTQKPQGISGIVLKNLAKKLLDDANLLTSVPAAGVMFISKDAKQLYLDPVVWVRNVETFFYETACASGTTAVGLVESLASPRAIFTKEFFQPSGMSISVKICKNSQSFISAYIDGEIKERRINYEK